MMVRRHGNETHCLFPDAVRIALIWFKDNFIKCNDRAALVKTWLPVEFEPEDYAWLDQLVYDRALHLVSLYNSVISACADHRLTESHGGAQGAS